MEFLDCNLKTLIFYIIVDFFEMIFNPAYYLALTIEVGKQADLVCLNENPLENISNVRKINRVIQSGKIVIDNN